MRSVLQKSRGTAFSQQKCKGIQPLITPVAIIVILVTCAIIFIPMGLALLDASDKNVLVSKRYDDLEGCEVTQLKNGTIGNRGTICTVSFILEKDMKAPIYFYYEIDNFFQNHRKYLSSKSDTQLRNKGSSNDGDCKPIKNQPLPSGGSKTIYPCGLIARSIFLDRFTLSYVRNNELTSLCERCDNLLTQTNNITNNWQNYYDTNWKMKGISWKTDRDFKFKEDIKNKHVRFGEYQKRVTNISLPTLENEDLIVWMRPGSTQNIRKLHRIIKKESLQKGDNITVTILNYMPVDKFNGKKKFVLATTTSFGTENKSLGWTLIITALIYIGFAIIFATLLLFKTRKLAEINRYEWRNRPPVENETISISQFDSTN